MKKTLVFLSTLVIATAVFAQQRSDITAKELKEYVTFLASDSLKGRKPGTPENNVAAAYIFGHFRDAGLRPMAENGFQFFDVIINVSLGEKNSLSFNGWKGMAKKDFIPLSFSSNGTVNAPVVFAGYGFDIDQDSLKWKDYEGIDVRNKWVLLLRGDPEIDNMESKFVPYSDVRSKVLTAKDKGAAGVLLVTPPGYEKEDKLIGLTSENNDVTGGILLINIKRAVADSMLKRTGFTTDSLEKILNKTRKQASFEVPVTVNGSAEVIQQKARTENVIGWLEGSDPLLKNEYIVVGAHYDHLGFGGPGSGSRQPDTIAIHNGADDNASGTAMVMALAGKISADRVKMKRSVIFVAFTGEEMGLLGSKYFVNHPPVDLKAIKCMFNFDMVGRFNKEKNAISVSGTGTSAEADSILKIYEKGLSFEVTHSTDGYGPSDHASFYSSNIPVFYFTTGVHMDYHTPFDDADKLDYDKEKEIGDFACKVIENVDDTPKALTFKESGRKESYGRSGRRLKVTLGIMPDFAGTEKKGLRVDGVTKDGPADKGGLKKGDIIISINGMKVENIYEYMSRLQKLQHGQTISVEVIRDGKNEVLIVQL